MAVPYQHARGTRAALTTLAASNGLRVGQVYYLTDEDRLAVGKTTSTFVTLAKESEVTGTTSAAFLVSGTAAASPQTATIPTGHSATSIIVTVNGFRLMPVTDYTVSGTTVSISDIVIGDKYIIENQGGAKGTDGAGGGGAWGSITGTLANQTDLSNALAAKAPTANPTFTGTVTIPILATPQIEITDTAPSGSVSLYAVQSSSASGELILQNSNSSSTITVRCDNTAATYNTAKENRLQVANTTLLTLSEAGTSAVTLTAGTLTRSSLNIPHGVAPTAPVDGDVWTTTGGVYARVNGTTVGLSGTNTGDETSATITTKLGYTPTSVTGLTGAQTVSAFKTGLTLVKGDVGLGSVDNTADSAKNVLSATKLTTARTINGVSFDGSANITINAVDSTARVPETRTISTTAPLTGGGDLSANRTLAISAATTSAAGSMSSADKSKLDGIATGATANSTDANLRDRSTHTGTQAISTILAAASARLFGRITASGGAGEELTGTQATTLLDTFTAALKGLVPAPGSTTGRFLKDDGTWATPSGGTDPWTYKKLTADYTNATTTFADISDGTNVLNYTPPANSDWTLEARLLVWTTAAANLPRVGVLIPAGATRGMGGANIWQAGATATASVMANGAWSDAAGVTVVQIPAGGVLTASVPYLCEVTISGRSGASPTAISLQMACETAAASTCYIKRGSFIRTRTI